MTSHHKVTTVLRQQNTLHDGILNYSTLEPITIFRLKPITIFRLRAQVLLRHTHTSRGKSIQERQVKGTQLRGRPGNLYISLTDDLETYPW